MTHFTQKDFELVAEIADSLYAQYERLYNDEAFLEHLLKHTKPENNNSKSILKVIVLMDITKTYQYIHPSNDDAIAKLMLYVLAHRFLEEAEVKSTWFGKQKFDKRDAASLCKAFEKAHPTTLQAIEKLMAKPQPIKGKHTTLPLVMHSHKMQNELLSYATQLYRAASLIARTDGEFGSNDEKKLVELWKELDPGQTQPATTAPETKEAVTEAPEKVEPPKLEDVLEELNKLYGLQNIKKEVNELISLIKVTQLRKEQNLKNPDLSYHMVFMGSPGTGKTTIARLLAKIYHALGLLKKGHLIEVDRSDLIGQYVGQTAPKVDQVVDSALGGVLFIDEAYSIVSSGENDFGSEAIATLLKRMEDERDNIVVIVAGYQKEMNDFIMSNPGLRSRFNKYFYFEDYLPDDLFKIFQLFVGKYDYTLSKDAEKKVLEVLTDAYNKRDHHFGNARFARNLFEQVVQNQANRIAAEEDVTREKLMLLTDADLAELDINEALHQS